MELSTSSTEIMQGVKLKHHLLTHVTQHSIVAMVAERLLSAVPQIASLSKSTELLVTVCRCIEACEIDKKKHKNIDKKQLVLDIYKRIYPTISPAELEQIGSDIEDLLANGLVKRIPYIKRAARFFGFSAAKKKG
jgi:hypothetical protein